MKRRVLRVLLALLAMGLCTSMIPQTIYAKDVNNERAQQVEQQPMVKASDAGQQKNHGETENNVRAFNHIQRNTANPESDFSFNSANGEITVYNGASTDVVIPETIRGVPVTRIGANSFLFARIGKKINSIILPSGLKSIGNDAFGAQKFTNIVLPEGLESIEEAAFLSCENLKEIILPDSLTSLGRAAFKQCTSLSKVELSAGLKVIPNDAFSAGPGNASITEAIFKNGLEEVGIDAFYGQKLRSVTLPDSIKIIKRQAFGGQREPEMHKDIVIGKSIQEIHAQDGNVGNIANAFVGWKGRIIFSISKDEATARGVNAILTYPGAPYKVDYASTVKYETNGGEPEIVPEIVPFDNPIKNKPTNPSKKGYDFAGWYTDGQFTTPWDFNNTVTSDMTLFAKWNPIVYKIHFDANTGTGTMDDMSFIINDNLTLTANKYTKEGYTFKEWNTKADGTGTPYADGKVLQNMPKGSLTLYAQWERNKYTISYEFVSEKNPDGISVPEDITVEHGSKADDPKITAPENWTFDGWYTDKKCTQKFDFNTEITGNINLYGKWSPIVYKIHFDANTGTGTMDDMSFIINDNLTLTANKYTKEGYTFKEWNTKADGTGTPYADGKVLQNMPKGSLTLYAQWERNKYTISYEFVSEKNPDGISVPEDITVEHGSKADDPKITAPENWTFDGWYTDKKCTQKFDFNTEITGNVNLFGKWIYTDPENTKPEVSTKPSEPTKPSGPSKPIVPETKPSNSPKTDDTSDLSLILLFLIVSSGLMLSIAVKRKK